MLSPSSSENDRCAVHDGIFMLEHVFVQDLVEIEAAAIISGNAVRTPPPRLLRPQLGWANARSSSSRTAAMMVTVRVRARGCVAICAFFATKMVKVVHALLLWLEK
jgi:hypothetical protein